MIYMHHVYAKINAHIHEYITSSMYKKCIHSVRAVLIKIVGTHVALLFLYLMAAADRPLKSRLGRSFMDVSDIALWRCYACDSAGLGLRVGVSCSWTWRSLSCISNPWSPSTRELWLLPWVHGVGVHLRRAGKGWWREAASSGNGVRRRWQWQAAVRRWDRSAGCYDYEPATSDARQSRRYSNIKICIMYQILNKRLLRLLRQRWLREWFWLFPVLGSYGFVGQLVWFGGLAWLGLFRAAIF